MKRDPFRRAADRLAEYLLSKADYLQNPKKQRLREELTALSGGRKTAVREYYAGKIRMVLLLLTGLFILTIVLLVFAPSRNDSLPEQRLKRREFGMAPQLQELEAEIEGESERQGLTVRVHAQRLTKDETSRLLEKAREELEQGMLGENLSRDEVRTALNLPAALAEGRVRAEYLTVPYGIIGQDGTIRRRTEERGEIVEITATLSCQGRKLLY